MAAAKPPAPVAERGKRSGKSGSPVTEPAVRAGEACVDPGCKWQHRFEADGFCHSQASGGCVGAAGTSEETDAQPSERDRQILEKEVARKVTALPGEKVPSRQAHRSFHHASWWTTTTRHRPVRAPLRLPSSKAQRGGCRSHDVGREQFSCHRFARPPVHMRT